jgi:hypothetical protein
MRTNTLAHPLARRIAWALAAVALVIMFALAACGTGASQTGGTNSNPGTTGNTSSPGSGTGAGAGNSAAARQAQSADQQIQAALQAMDNAQTDANVDHSGQDSPVQP